MVFVVAALLGAAVGAGYVLGDAGRARTGGAFQGEMPDSAASEARRDALSMQEKGTRPSPETGLTAFADDTAAAAAPASSAPWKAMDAADATPARMEARASSRLTERRKNPARNTVPESLAQPGTAAALPEPRVEAAEEKDEETLPVLFRRFTQAVEAGREADAQALIAKVSAQAGKDVIVVARMEGYLALRSGQLDRSRRFYEEVIARAPDDREAGMNLALIDLQQGLAGEARKRIRHLQELYPNDASVRAVAASIRQERP